MTVFRVPDGPRPVDWFPAPPAAPAPLLPPRAPDPAPGRAVAAGLLGIAAAVLAALTGSFVVALTAVFEPGAAVWLAVVVVVLTGGHFAGAVLVLCRRKVWLLVLTALPLVAVGALVLHAAMSGRGPSGVSTVTVVPVGMGACAAGAAILAASPTVRRWTAARVVGSGPLREVPRWP